MLDCGMHMGFNDEVCWRNVVGVVQFAIIIYIFLFSLVTLFDLLIYILIEKISRFHLHKQ